MFAKRIKGLVAKLCFFGPNSINGLSSERKTFQEVPKMAITIAEYIAELEADIRRNRADLQPLESGQAHIGSREGNGPGAT